MVNKEKVSGYEILFYDREIASRNEYLVVYYHVELLHLSHSPFFKKISHYSVITLILILILIHLSLESGQEFRLRSYLNIHKLI